MGILSNIFRKIFPSSHPAAQGGAQTSTGSMQSGATQQPNLQQASVQPATQPGRTAPPPNAPMDIVDVEVVVSRMAAQQGQDLNWRSSIVDLLKVLNLDSSLESRKELARELDYKGDTGDTATMNIWLHRQVMNRLAANGGKVPDDMKD
jgi:hypothetical protein